jgi:hypothetical protein
MTNILAVAHFAMMQMGRLTFSKFAAGLFAIAAVGLLIVDASLGYEAAYVFNTGGTAWLMAIGAVMAAVLKFGWLTGVMWAARLRWWGVVIGGVLLGILCHAYSMQAALGLAASGRDTVTSSRDGQIQLRSRAEEAYALAKARVEKFAGQRAAVKVQEDIASTELTLKDAQTAQVSASSRQAAEKASGLGPRYNLAVEDEKSAARKVEVLRAKLESLKGEVTLSRQAERADEDLKHAKDELAKISAPAHKDPQAYALSSYLNAFGLPATVDGVSLAMPLPLVFLVEFGGGLGLMLAAALWQGTPAPRVEAEATKPSGGIAIAVPAPRPQPVAPLALPPAPVSPEEAAYRKLRHLIVQEGGKIPSGGRAIAKALNVPHSSMAEYLKRWDANGRIVRIADGKEKMIGLPIKARMQTSRELQMA